MCRVGKLLVLKLFSFDDVRIIIQQPITLTDIWADDATRIPPAKMSILFLPTAIIIADNMYFSDQPTHNRRTDHKRSDFSAEENLVHSDFRDIATFFLHFWKKKNPQFGIYQDLRKLGGRSFYSFISYSFFLQISCTSTVIYLLKRGKVSLFNAR